MVANKEKRNRTRPSPRPSPPQAPPSSAGGAAAPSAGTARKITRVAAMAWRWEPCRGCKNPQRRREAGEELSSKTRWTAAAQSLDAGALAGALKKIEAAGAPRDRRTRGPAPTRTRTLAGRRRAVAWLRTHPTVVRRVAALQSGAPPGRGVPPPAWARFAAATRRRGRCS